MEPKIFTKMMSKMNFRASQRAESTPLVIE